MDFSFVRNRLVLNATASQSLSYKCYECRCSRFDLSDLMFLLKVVVQCC